MTFQNILANSNPILQTNENFQSLAGAGVYGLRQPGTSGLDIGLWGGYFDGGDRSDSTTTLSASSTNYLVLSKSGYAVSDSTSSTNYDDDTNYWRIGVATTSGSAITAFKDARFSPGGVFAGGGGGGGGSSVPPVVTESGTSLAADDTNSGNYTRFTSGSAKTYTFDDGETYTVGAEYHGRNAGAGDLTLTEAGGMTLNPPAGGTLVIPEGGTFTVKIIASDEADVFGVTVAL